MFEYIEGFNHRGEALLPTPQVWIGEGGWPEPRRAIEQRVSAEVARNGVRRQ